MLHVILLRCQGPLLQHCHQRCCPFRLGHCVKSRGKHRPSLTLPRHKPETPVSLRLITRCGLFTVFSVNALFFGSAIWGSELWRRKSPYFKQDRNTQRSFARDFLRKVRTKCELLLGRPFNATDVYWVIVTFNLLVFFGHRTPLKSIFLRYFANSLYSPTPALSMFLSVFSHHSLLHLGINMYVLHSFTPTLIGIIGSGEFLSVFLGGGIFASFMSLLNKAIHRSSIPSLGASGAICAVLGAFCLLQPNARLCVPFVVDIIPHSFKAENAAWTLLFLELFAAFILSRSPIDHAAHFGGLLFGMYIIYCGRLLYL
ncbi:rhomboid-like protein [Paragonimus westermani]|uniref:rhomboid protease n=1 Tax=Paragonimus westermani TaxID=34504 RepID=A0A5J4NCE9_9TREM|nr:rhomboid-like protein [Paragonimus westermani]